MQASRVLFLHLYPTEMSNKPWNRKCKQALCSNKSQRTAEFLSHIPPVLFFIMGTFQIGTSSCYWVPKSHKCVFSPADAHHATTLHSLLCRLVPFPAAGCTLTGCLVRMSSRFALRLAVPHVPRLSEVSMATATAAAAATSVATSATMTWLPQRCLGFGCTEKGE